MEIQQVKSEKTNNQSENKELSRYRELLKLIVLNPPKTIEVGDWDDNGDIIFSVPMTEIGLTYNDYKKYSDEFFCYFVIDFLGELIIRDNLGLFVDKLQKYDLNDYIMAIQVDHNRFGVKTEKGKLIFKFHVSLLKDILTEKLRERLGE